MKAVKITLLGEPRYLAFTGEAMFQVRDGFGGAKQMLEAMLPDTRQGFAALCRVAALLAQQGELARRALGYDPAALLQAETLERTATPAEIVALKTAVPRAIELGYGREVLPQNDEVDLGLAELRQKKTN